MNLHELTQTEASYLLFAIKKALRDRPGLTPGMEQFFDSTYDALSQKLQRIASASDGDIPPPARDKFAKVRPTWGGVPLTGEPQNPPTNP